MADKIEKLDEKLEQKEVLVEDNKKDLSQNDDVAKKSIDSLEEAKEEIKEVIKEEVASEVENVDNKETVKELNLNQDSLSSNNKDELKAKVDEIKQDAQAIYNEYTTYTDKFEESSAELATQENEILQKSVNKTMELLKELGIDKSDIKDAINEVKLDNKEELLRVKYPSKGRFKGFILGILASGATLLGLGAYGAKLSDLPLSLSTFMQKSNLDTIVSKYLAMANLDKPALYGYIGVGALSLLVGFIVYKIVTFMQKLKNERYVNSLDTTREEYKNRLKNKIEDLKELLEHLDKIKLVNQKYDVILQEQNAKINRMIFIEKPTSLEELHNKSKQEVEKTILILDELVKLMNTPVSKDDKINPESVTNLENASNVIEDFIKKLYS